MRGTGERPDVEYLCLDHWRGIAALAVVVLHGFPQAFREPNQIHEGLLWLRQLASFGWFGVDLFFVISGYCIAANVFRLSQSELGPWDFLRDRLLRIYPVYWGACLAAITFGIVASLFSKAPVESILPLDGTAAIANILLLEPYFGYDGLLLVAWSLTFELAFYVVVAIGFALCRMNVRADVLLVTAVMLAIIGLIVPAKGPLLFLNAWPEFTVGGVVFVALWMRPRQSIWSHILIVCIPFGFAVLLMIQNLPAGRYVAVAIFAQILYFLKPWDTHIAAARGLRPLAWLGGISYSLYLVHVPFGGRFINLTMRWVAPESMWLLAVQMGYWATAILCAYLFFQACERPTEIWRRSLRRRKSHTVFTKSQAQNTPNT